jgi:hypothetical protein
VITLSLVSKSPVKLQKHRGPFAVGLYRKQFGEKIWIQPVYHVLLASLPIPPARILAQSADGQRMLTAGGMSFAIVVPMPVRT